MNIIYKMAQPSDLSGEFDVIINAVLTILRRIPSIIILNQQLYSNPYYDKIASFEVAKNAGHEVVGVRFSFDAPESHLLKISDLVTSYAKSVNSITTAIVIIINYVCVWILP